MATLLWDCRDRRRREISHWIHPGADRAVKPGFKGSIEERAFKRASEEGGPKLKLVFHYFIERLFIELEFRTAFL